MEEFYYEFLKMLYEVEFDFIFILSLEYNSLESCNYINIVGYDVDIFRLGEIIGVIVWEVKEVKGF